MVNEQVGKLIEGDSHRDAIHVAVAPIVAKEKLWPGDEVGVDGTKKNPVGIVDPFLKNPVQPEQKFFVWLFPNTVTDIHHHWFHPAFDGKPEPDPKTYARERIAEIAKRIGDDFDTYESLMAHVQRCIAGGEHYVERDSQHMRDVWGEVADEFWKHYETITGQKEPGDYTPIFCCSC